MTQNREQNALANPVGLDGIDFIEYASPDPAALENLFVRLGFQKVAQHKRKAVSLYRQGRINFVLNQEPDTFATDFAAKHGPSICAMGVRVHDVKKAMDYTVSQGARLIPTANDPSSHSFPAIYGIGDAAFYFIERGGNHFDQDFDFLTQDVNPVGLGLDLIDHLTNNVPKGEMQKWCDFYRNVFNFHEARYFDIRGEQTGLFSKVMRSPCGQITIPINEPTENKSQIQEYLDEYKGSGIQHVALLTNNILASVGQLREKGVAFLDVPETYYEAVPERVPQLQEDLSQCAKLKVLVDGDDEGYLLQIFTQNLIGPIFYEIIQRHHHNGFGEGNFQALFDAIERDQKRRGYL